MYRTLQALLVDGYTMDEASLLLAMHAADIIEQVISDLSAVDVDALPENADWLRPPETQAKAKQIRKERGLS